MKTITTRPISDKQIELYIDKLKSGKFFDEEVKVYKAKLFPCLNRKCNEIINYISMHCKYGKKDDVNGLIVSYKGRVLCFKESDTNSAKKIRRILNTKYKYWS